MLAWLLADPLHWEREITEVDALTERPKASIGRCVCDQPLTFLLPLLCFVLSTLAVGNYLSFKGRRIPVSFSEGKWIAVSLIKFFECKFNLLCIPIMIVTVRTPSTRPCLSS